MRFFPRESEPAALAQMSGAVVGHGEGEEDEEEEYGGDDDEFEELFVCVAEVHEEERHEQGFGGGNGERYGGVENSEVEFGSVVGKCGADEQ